MFKKIIILTALSLSCLSSYAQTESTYSKTLSTMFEVSGSVEAYQGAIKQMFGMFKQQYTEVEASVWAELEQEFASASITDLTTMLVPVYQKHLTEADLKELIAFYESPVGKKFATSTPLIMAESMQVGQEWGMKIGQDFQKKMEERGY